MLSQKKKNNNPCLKCPQLYPFQVTHHPARQYVTARQSIYIFVFINLSFHPGNMTNLMHS